MLNKSEKEVQDAIAEFYPIRYSGTGFLYHSRIVTDMLKGAKFRDGKTSDKILDVGCGIGFVSQLFPNFDITGIDISDEMLKRNPHKWLNAPAENMPFQDSTFDYVVCRSLLHHLEVPQEGLREMFRVLKPGGKFISWDPNQGIPQNMIRHLFQKTDRFSHLHKSFTDNELLKMIESVGFKIEEVRHIGFLAYPLLAFPDIRNFGFSIQMGRRLMAFDEWLEKFPILRNFAWSIMVKATK